MHGLKSIACVSMIALLYGAAGGAEALADVEKMYWIDSDSTIRRANPDGTEQWCPRQSIRSSCWSEKGSG